MYYGGGMDLMNEFYATHDLYALPAGNTGAQMGGWFRKEIKTVDDLKGVKMRIGGFGGKVISSSAWCRSRSPAATSTPRSRRARSTPPNGSAPMTTRSSASTRWRPYYYYPGWWEGGAMLHCLDQKEKWEGLPASYKAIVTRPRRQSTATCRRNTTPQPGGHASGWSRRAPSSGRSRTEILEACFNAAKEIYAEISATNAAFKKVHDAMMAFRATSICGSSCPNTRSTPS